MNILKLTDPKAAVAVASAGAIVLTITTTLCNSFNLPGSYVALVLSALMATTLVPNLKKNIVNYLFMALVIFHLAKGGNLTMSAAEDALTQTKNNVTTVGNKAENAVKAPAGTEFFFQAEPVAVMLAPMETPLLSDPNPDISYSTANNYPLAPETTVTNSYFSENFASNITEVASNQLILLDNLDKLEANKSKDSESEDDPNKIFRRW